MSELLLYILATAVVLAGVAYFFVKQREQEALANKSASQSRTTSKKAKKQEKPKKEAKEPREPRQRKVKKEEPEPVPTSTKKKGKEEDETKNVLDFLKNKRVTSEKTAQTAQAKVKSGPPPKPQTKAPAPAAVFYSDDSESDDDTEGYDTIKRKIKSVKEKAAETTVQSDNNQQTKKNKFFTKQEAEDHKNAGLQRKKDREARQAEREAFKALPAAERKRLRKIAEKAKAEEAGFEAPKSRPRRDRGEGDAEEENEDGSKRSKYPPREADSAPVFASEYETADMDHILNNLTSYYTANPQAGRGNARRARQPAAPKQEEESGKSEETDE